MHEQIVTIERHIIDQQKSYPEATGAFSSLLYKASPLAFIVEQAGGYASDGRHKIMDIQPEDLHQRAPLFIGNRDLVEQAETFISRYDG